MRERSHAAPSPTSGDKPFGNTRMARFLDRHIDEMTAAGWRHLDIARAIGYERGNIIAMFKKGDTKVPIDKVPALAKALDVDAGFMMRLGLEQYWPDKDDMITEVLGGIYTHEEKAIIQTIREASGHTDPCLTTERQRELRRLFADAA